MLKVIVPLGRHIINAEISTPRFKMSHALFPTGSASVNMALVSKTLVLQHRPSPQNWCVHQCRGPRQSVNTRVSRGSRTRLPRDHSFITSLIIQAPERRSSRANLSPVVCFWTCTAPSRWILLFFLLSSVKTAPFATFESLSSVHQCPSLSPFYLHLPTSPVVRKSLIHVSPIVCHLRHFAWAALRGIRPQRVRNPVRKKWPFPRLSNGKEQWAGKRRGLIRSMCPLSSRCLPCLSACLSACLLFVGSWVFIFTLDNPSTCLPSVCLSFRLIVFCSWTQNSRGSRTFLQYLKKALDSSALDWLSQHTAVRKGFRAFKWLDSYPSHNAIRETLIPNLFCNMTAPTLYVQPDGVALYLTEPVPF